MAAGTKQRVLFLARVVSLRRLGHPPHVGMLEDPDGFGKEIGVGVVAA